MKLVVREGRVKQVFTCSNGCSRNLIFPGDAWASGRGLRLLNVNFAQLFAFLGFNGKLEPGSEFFYALA
jgi:hypothetical protein